MVNSAKKEPNKNQKVKKSLNTHSTTGIEKKKTEPTNKRNKKLVPTPPTAYSGK